MNTSRKLLGRVMVVILTFVIIMSIPAAVLASTVSGEENTASSRSQSVSDSENAKLDSSDAAEKTDGTTSATVSGSEKSGKHKHSDSSDSSSSSASSGSDSGKSGKHKHSDSSDSSSSSASSDSDSEKSGKHKHSDSSDSSSSSASSDSEKKGTPPNKKNGSSDENGTSSSTNPGKKSTLPSEKSDTSSNDAASGGNTPPDGAGTPPDGNTPPDGFAGGNGTPPDGFGGGNGAPPEGGMGTPPGGGSSKVDSYTAVKEYTEDTTVTGEEIKSTGTDENAVLVSEGNVVLSDVTVTRNSSDSSGGDNASFYGVGAAVLTKGGTSYITDANISTDASGGAGAFAYSNGVVYIADSVINTLKGASGGIHAAGGGTLYAWDLDVTTNGQSSAAIRSDRGGGTMVVEGGSYTSNGAGSPAIYCTADIAVKSAVLAANGSEAICIEGLNTLYLFDCNLTGSMQDDTAQNDCTWTVIVYQSMSGDSQVGCGTFQMIGGKLTSTNGGLFYTTNTESNFVLQNVDIEAADDSEFFLRCTGNNNSRGWGTVGKNGADCVFTAIEQEMNGDIVWDSVSTLKLYMTSGSALTGAFINDESCAGSGSNGYAELYISEDSKWTVTGDSTLTNLYNAGTIVDKEGNAVTVKGTDGTVYMNGTSKYTVTVTSYKNTADLSAAGTAESWESHKVEKPALLSVSKTSETASEEISSESSEHEESSESIIEEASSAVDSDSESNDSNNTALYIIIIAACVLIAAGAATAVILIKRKQESSQQTSEN